MAEITNNKKNIILLFIIMIIILFFIYKGFIADGNHYLEDYKKYLLSINASKYYLNKIEKYYKKNSNKNKSKKELEELNIFLIKLKNLINNTINKNQKIVNDLKYIDYTEQQKLNTIINETLHSLNETNHNNYIIIDMISKYLRNNFNS